MINHERSNFLFDSVLSDVCAAVGPQADKQGVGLLFDVSAAVPAWLVGDPARVGQALTNRCSDALHAAQSGDLIITVRMVGRDDESVTMNVAVALADTGAGLARARRDVESEGTFRFSLPHDRMQTACEQLPQPHVDAPVRSLLFDANCSGRRVLATMLGTLGTEVVVVADAETAAVRIARAHRQGEAFDLVVLDSRSAGDRSMGLIAQAIDPRARCGVVLLTAFGRCAGGKAVSADTEGIVVLAKPVTRTALHAACTQALGCTTPFGDAGVSRLRRVTGSVNHDAGARMPADSFGPEPAHQPTAAARGDGAALAPGLNIEAGLHNAIDDADLYRKLLSIFERKWQDFGASYRLAHERGGAAAAERMAHTLKSAAAVIGAEALASAAANLETGWRDCRPDAANESSAAQVEAALSGVLAEIRHRLDASSPPPS